MHLVDCSQPLETGMPVYPGDDPVSIAETATVPADGSALRRIECSSHVGTHVDAPAHKIADGPTLEDFHVSAFHFEARVVDCTAATAREPLGPAVLPDDLRAESRRADANVPEATDANVPETTDANVPEATDANVPETTDADVPEATDADVSEATDADVSEATDADMLVFHTGWDEHWGTDRYRDSPFLDAALATWCADYGFHVGIDAFSPDPVPSADPDREGAEEPTDQPAHAALCGADRLIVENLRGLDRLPDRFDLRAVPLRIRDGDGSPVRAVAEPLD